MDLHLIPTALNKALLFSVLVFSGLNAKDIPIVESITINVVSEGKSVIEFPFKITSIGQGDFTVDKSGGKDALASFNVQGSSAGDAPDIKKGDNVLEITSTSSGVMELIVWGYDHPIFLKTKFEASGEKYFRFTEAIGKNEDIKTLESNYHEDVIVDLVTAAFNEKMPKGYSSKTKKSVGKSGDVYWSLQLEYIGNEYAVQTWKVTNGGKEVVDLYEEMFVSEKDRVYGVSIESNRLKPNEATRVFIVRRAG